MLTRSQYDVEVLTIGATATITLGQILTVLGVLLIAFDAWQMYNKFSAAANAIQQMKQRQMESGAGNLFERTGNLIALHMVETVLWLFEDRFD
jgi:hypothetical protein